MAVQACFRICWRAFGTVPFASSSSRVNTGLIPGKMAVARTLACLLALFFVFVMAVGNGITVTPQTAEPVLLPHTNSSEISGVADIVLPVVECEFGDKDWRGLSCEKEGYFISDFQHEVYWDRAALIQRDKVPVPAARAICCRLKMVRELPTDVVSLFPRGAVPKSIISIGCHKSSATESASMRCAPHSTGSNSFIVGFLDYRRTSTSPPFFYPVDGAVCCSPVLKLSSGDALELRRCGCVTSDGIQCGRRATDRLLVGFSNVGTSEAESVPLAPALCCKVCVGTRLYDMSQCGDLNHCSDHGICIMGSCSCQTGWTGPDCSKQVGSGGSSDAWWQSFWWLGVIGFMCAFTGLFATFWMIQRAEWADRAPDPDGSEESLLQWVDVEGSAGSEDTSVSERSSNASPPSTTLGGEIASVGDAGDGIVRQNEDSTEGPGLLNQRVEGSPVNRAVGTQAETTESEPEQARTSQEIEVDDSADAASSEIQKTGDDESGTQLSVKQLVFNSESNPLAGIPCAVCMTHPIQVALVPCGHSNLCRRCSRKLQRCPFCRKEIFRRQKLFLSG